MTNSVGVNKSKNTP